MLELVKARSPSFAIRELATVSTLREHPAVGGVGARRGSSMSRARFASVATMLTALLAACAGGAAPTAAAVVSRAQHGQVGTTALFAQSMGLAGPNTFWALAGPGVIVSSDGGAQWRDVTVSGLHIDYFDDVASYGSNLWFADDEAPESNINSAMEGGSVRAELIGRSTDGGRTWRVVDFPESELSDVTLSFVSALVGFALGGATSDSTNASGALNTLFRTTNGGASWEEVSIAAVQGPVEFTSPLDGWARPEGTAQTDWNGIERTTDGGATWQFVQPAGKGGAAQYGVPRFFNQDDGAVLAQVASGVGPHFDVFSTVDDGRSWTRHPLPGSSDGMPVLAAVSPSDWFVATSAGLEATTDGGAHWHAIAVAQWGYIVPRLIDFSSPAVGIALTNSGMLRTRDGGASWSSITASSVLAGAAPTTIDDFPTSSQSGTLNGAWAPLTRGLAVPKGDRVTDLSCSSVTQCLAVDSEGRVATLTGSTWSVLQTVDSIGIDRISCSSERCLTVDLRARVVEEQNGTWSTLTTTGVGAAADVSCSGAVCAIVGQSGAALLSAQGRLTLSGSATALTEVSCSGPTFCLALGVDGLAETFDGRHWLPTPPDTPANTAPLEFTSLSCGSPTFCVLLQAGGQVSFFVGNGWVTGTEPQWGASGPPFAPVSVSCDGVGLCAAPDSARAVSVLTLPGWQQPNDIDGQPEHLSVSCGAPTSCVAVDAGGHTIRFTATFTSVG